MSNGHEGVSFGFSPQGKPNQHATRPPVRPAPYQEAAAVSQLETAPLAGGSFVASNTKWTWLIIGVLLGAGGTMIGSSLWLPGNYVNPSVAMDAEPDPLGEAAELDANTTRSTVASDTDEQPAVAFDQGQKPAPALPPSENEPSLAQEQSETLLVTNNDIEPITGSQPSATIEESAETVEPLDNPVTPLTPASLPAEQVIEPDVTVAAFDVSTSTPIVDSLPETQGNHEAAIRGSISATAEAVDLLDEPAPVQGIDQANPDPATSVGLTELDLEAVGSEAGEAELSIAGNAILDASATAGAGGVRDEPAPIEETGEADTTPAASVGLTGLNLETVESETTRPETSVTENTVQAVLENEPIDAPRPAQASERIYRVQLAAVDNEIAAQEFWQELTTRLPGLFVDIDPVFDQREVDERIFFRIWVGAFEKRIDADDYCSMLSSKGQDCFVTRG
ncbi:MAG: SPOR domain-containing protein [Geminicoccales bacterium]